MVQPGRMQTTLAVLQYLSMEGIAETEELVEVVDGDVRETLEDLEAEGYVENEGFWYLTDAGEERLNEVCRDRFSADQREALRGVFDRFEALDSEMKDLASDWQAGEYGADEMARELTRVQQDVEALFDELPPAVRSVYSRHTDALADAVEKLRNGHEEYVTGTDIDSYHTVWFRLHDDLLRTLGEGREE